MWPETFGMSYDYFLDELKVIGTEKDYIVPKFRYINSGMYE